MLDQAQRAVQHSARGIVLRVPGCECGDDQTRVGCSYRRTRSSVSRTCSAVRGGSLASGTATSPLPRFFSFMGVEAISISSRPSPARISSGWPGLSPRAWRSGLGATILPARSMTAFMVRRMPRKWHFRNSLPSWLSTAGSRRQPSILRPLQFHVLQRPRVREAADQVDARLLHARADAPDERQLVDRDVGHPVVEDLLDLVQQRLALLHVQLAHLALEEILDLGDDAGRVGAALAHVRLEPRGGVGAGAADADDHVLELAVAPRRGERRPLHAPYLRPDAD